MVKNLNYWVNKIYINNKKAAEILRFEKSIGQQFVNY
jgi:hypothetical protein